MGGGRSQVAPEAEQQPPEAPLPPEVVQCLLRATAPCGTPIEERCVQTEDFATLDRLDGARGECVALGPPTPDGRRQCMLAKSLVQSWRRTIFDSDACEFKELYDPSRVPLLAAWTDEPACMPPSASAWREATPRDERLTSTVPVERLTPAQALWRRHVRVFRQMYVRPLESLAGTAQSRVRNRILDDWTLTCLVVESCLDSWLRGHLSDVPGLEEPDRHRLVPRARHATADGQRDLDDARQRAEISWASLGEGGRRIRVVQLCGSFIDRLLQED